MFRLIFTLFEWNITFSIYLNTQADLIFIFQNFFFRTTIMLCINVINVTEFHKNVEKY